MGSLELELELESDLGSVLGRGLDFGADFGVLGTVLVEASFAGLASGSLRSGSNLLPPFASSGQFAWVPSFDTLCGAWSSRPGILFFPLAGGAAPAS